MISRKPAFVLIHGAWHGMPTWDNIAPLLEGQDYPARMLDLPGAGAHAQMPLKPLLVLRVPRINELAR